jgi:glycosyltransferase involved in cell wall biosynthesis
MHDRGDDSRPGLVIVSNSITPYRVNLHRLIAGGIPEFSLQTVVTHGISDFDWAVDLPPEIHTVNFSSPGEHPTDPPLKRPLVEWRKSKRLIQHLRNTRAVAVILNSYNYLPYLWLMNYCSRRGIPFFVRNDSNILGDWRVSPFKRLIKRAVYRWWIKRATGIFSMGALGDEFFQSYGADPSRFYRVPYWPDYDAFKQVDPNALERFKRRFGLRGERRYLLYSGRLVRDKRVDLLIDAFSALASERPEWDVIVVGDGHLGAELRQRVPAHLRQRFVWTGFLDSGELALAYHCGDVLVLPSEWEPWAVVVQEAMAAGLAIVASDVVGASHELIQNNFGGRIFKSRDVNSLRQALLEVTAAEQIDLVKREAIVALETYRKKVEPVAEIRRALREAGALEPVATAREQSVPICSTTNG